MIQPTQKRSFFARSWGWFLGGFLLLAAVGAAALFLIFTFVRGSADVTGLGLSQASVVCGDPVSASVQVRCTGLLPLKYRASVLVDGEPTPLEETTLYRGAPETLTLDLGFLKPGSHTVSIAGFEKDLRVLAPAAYSITGLSVSPGSPLVGDSVTASATVTNTGELEGTFAKAFICDGAAVETAALTLGPGQSKTVSATIPVKSGGAHTVELMGGKAVFTAVSQAKISVTGLSLSKPFAKPGEAVTASVSLQNTGDIDGPFDLELTIDGKSYSKQTVTVQAGAELTVPVPVSQPKAGTFAVKAGEFSKTLSVVVITRPKNGALLVKKANGGWGRLTVSNGYSSDVLFVLASAADPKTALLTVYIRAGSKVSGIKVKDGDYIAYFCTGEDFDSASNRFLTDPEFFKDDTAIAFKTSRSGYTVHYVQWTISLNVENGETNPEPVDSGDFPG